MRPVSAEFPINQPFGSMKTAGVAPSSTPNTVGWYVKQYGNYQPYGHAGADFKCPEGTPVYAIATGTVLWADWGTKLPGDETNAGYRKRWYLYKGFPGIVTVIQHAGWIGVYAHLSVARMNTGDKVREGQQIGLSGGTGGVAPHLHVEALVDLSYKTGDGLIYGRTNPERFFGAGGLAAQGTITPQEDTLSAAEVKQITDAIAEVKKIANNTHAGIWKGGSFNGQKFNYGILPIVAESQRRDSVNAAQIKGLVGALAAVAKGEKFDEAKLLAGVQAAAEAGIKSGLQDGTVTVDVNVNGAAK